MPFLLRDLYGRKALSRKKDTGLLLDNISGAVCAYSISKLKSTAIYAVKVRRDNDNAELDIGFNGNSLDETALSTFVGTNSAFVTTWYDQSGNENHAVQSTADRQPRIVNTGIYDESIINATGKSFVCAKPEIMPYASNFTGFVHGGYSVGGRIVNWGAESYVDAHMLSYSSNSTALRYEINNQDWTQRVSENFNVDDVQLIMYGLNSNLENNQFVQIAERTINEETTDKNNINIPIYFYLFRPNWNATVENVVGKTKNVIIFNRVLSVSEILEVKTKFKNKATISQNPYENIDWESVVQYKANLHTHSTESDGGFYGAEVIDDYNANNYDILLLTDHDNASENTPPNERGTATFINSWPWTKFEGTESYQAEVGSYELNTVTSVHANGMLSVETCEISAGNHIGCYDSTYAGSPTASRTAQLTEVQGSGGLAVFKHIGRYTWDSTAITDYIGYFNTFNCLVGVEIYNQGDRYSGDRDKWDELLTAYNNPVWGYSNDDMHEEAHKFRNYNFLLMDSLTKANFRSSLTNGTSYFCYEPLGSGEGKAPRITSITTISKTITVNATEETDIKWIYNKQIVGTGKTFDYTLYENSYVRAVITGAFGITYTQPIFFTFA